MKLSSIMLGTGARGDADGDAEVSTVTGDSREVVPGAVFFALRGAERDGHEFVAEAARRGAIAVVAERAVPCAPATLLLAPSSRRAMAVAAANLHGRPGEALHLAGVTGTNGKTTVAWLVEACARAAAVPVGLLGTVTHRWPGAERRAGHTTPESTTVQALLSQMRAAGARAAVLEVSSHALAQERVAGMLLPRGRVHEPHARPPRLPRRHGELLRGEAPAVPRAPRARRHRRRERPRSLGRAARGPARPRAARVAVRRPDRRRAAGRGGRRSASPGSPPRSTRRPVRSPSAPPSSAPTTSRTCSARRGWRSGSSSRPPRSRAASRSRPARPGGSSGSPRAASRCSSTTPTPTTRSPARSRRSARSGRAGSCASSGAAATGIAASAR